MDKVIITAAVVGAHPTKEMNPAVPYTPEDIAEAAIACYHAGAAIAHIHVRDPQTGAPSADVELFREVQERIRAACNMLVNLTTSGLHIKGDEMEVIETRLAPMLLYPDLCSLDIGSLNLRGRVFANSTAWGEVAAKRMRAYGVKPEIEVFDAGHVAQAVDMLERGFFADPPYFQLCMGTRWGIPASPENLLFMKNMLPPGAHWSVLGVGRHQLPMITMGILLGGNIRVGFEDNIYFRKGVLAESNAQLVENAASLVRQLQREVATPDEARAMLGI